MSVEHETPAPIEDGRPAIFSGAELSLYSGQPIPPELPAPGFIREQADQEIETYIKEQVADSLGHMHAVYREISRPGRRNGDRGMLTHFYSAGLHNSDNLATRSRLIARECAQGLALRQFLDELGYLDFFDAQSYYEARDMRMHHTRGTAVQWLLASPPDAPVSLYYREEEIEPKDSRLGTQLLTVVYAINWPQYNSRAHPQSLAYDPRPVKQ